MSNSLHILCIGDSHTAGFPLYDPFYGGNQESSYEYWLKKLLQKKHPEMEFNIENFGICGQISFDILQRLKKFNDLTQFNIVLFWGGANDIGMGFDVKSIAKNLEQASLHCIRTGSACFILTIPPMNYEGLKESIQELNRKILTNINIKAIDIYNHLVKGTELNDEYGIGDGVHLSITGYQQVAEAIFPHILEFISNFG